MKPLFRALLVLACVLLLGSCQKKEDSLNLLVWEGYADPSFLHDFEVSHHCKVTASYMGSSDDLVAKLRGGSASNYDVISPSSDVATSIARAHLAEPLDLTKIPSLLATLSQTARPSPRQSRRPNLRRPFHVGPQSSPL